MNTMHRVLVVDDEIILLLDLMDQLSAAGFEPQPATTAKGAISLLDSVDALVTDIDLPGNYSGLKLARLAARLRPGLPILVVSGGSVPAADELPPGAQFFRKPYRMETILSALAGKLQPRAA